MAIWVQNLLYLIGGGLVGAGISFLITKSKFEKIADFSKITINK